jgi:hypothetical protein
LILQAAQGVTKYAAVMSYPGATYEPDAEETDTAIGLADSVLTAVTGRVR